MKKLLILFLITPFCSYVFSQSENADNILKNFSGKFNKFQTIYTQFVFSNLDQNDELIDKFEGKLYLKDEKFKLVFPGNEIISDGIVLWQYNQDINEVTLTNKDADDESILSNPKKIFTIYEEEFKFKLNRELQLGDIMVYEIDLFPKKLDESTYSRIRLFINKTGLDLVKVKYFSKDGKNFSLDITDFKTSINWDDSFFFFDEKKYPGVEINDMR